MTHSDKIDRLSTILYNIESYEKSIADYEELTEHTFLNQTQIQSRIRAYRNLVGRYKKIYNAYLKSMEL